MSVYRIAAAIVAVLALLAAPALAAPALGPEQPEPVRLNATVSVSSQIVRLGDLFTGLENHKERPVAQAPLPGQRTVLTADFLTSLARSYSVDWKPRDAFDRAVVLRPGQAVTPADIQATLKADLTLKGLPEKFGLRVAGVLPTLTVPAEALPPISVRESSYDPADRSFSALLEVAGADGMPQLMSVRGVAVATVSVPVLKQDAGRTAVITQDMVEHLDIPEAQLRKDAITEASLLIGMTPRGFIAAHRPIHTSEVARVTLVDVPVLRDNMRRDGIIDESHVIWTPVNAAELPHDAVVDMKYLIGKSPRGLLAGGAPIRRGDIVAVRHVQMAVAARDLPAGIPLQQGDINWVAVTDNEVGTDAITSEALTRGRATVRPIRAGQALRAIDLIRPTVITRGKLVTIVYAASGMKLTVQGLAMEDGALAESIRVTNAKSKTVVLAEVVDANTVRVTPQQSAMQ